MEEFKKGDRVEALSDVISCPVKKGDIGIIRTMGDTDCAVNWDRLNDYWYVNYKNLRLIPAEKTYTVAEAITELAADRKKAFTSKVGNILCWRGNKITWLGNESAGVLTSGNLYNFPLTLVQPKPEPQKVEFMEAVEAHRSKNVYVMFGGTKRAYKCGKTFLDENGVGLSSQEILNGEWYII